MFTIIRFKKYICYIYPNSIMKFTLIIFNILIIWLRDVM